MLPKFPKKIQNYLPWISCSIFLIFLVVIHYNKILSINNGVFTYVLDDPYIHMAIAKNFAQRGVWGVTPFEFSSSSSSILFTWILSLFYFIFGNSSLTPLILNVIFALGLLFEINRIYSHFKIPYRILIIVEIAMVLIFPFVPVIFTGMEHILHAWVTMAFVHQLYSFIQKKSDPEDSKIKELQNIREESKSKKSKYKHQKFDEFRSWMQEMYKNNHQQIKIIVLAALLPVIRYEALMTLVIAVLFLGLSKNYILGVLILFFGLLPMSIFGLIALGYGWFFLPNSIMIKGGVGQFLSIFESFTQFRSYISEKILILKGQNHFNSLIVIIIIGAFIHIIIQKKGFSIYTLASLIVLAGYLFHGFFARFCSFCRYGFYLIILGGLTLFLELFSLFRYNYNRWIKNKQRKIERISYSSIQAIGLILIGLVGFNPIISRTTGYTGIIDNASNNIYEQQYQMAMFIREYYPHEIIGLNDIGAVNYYNSIELFDFHGLGTLASAKIKVNNGTRADIYEIAHNRSVNIAIVYSTWYYLPSGGWIPAASWQIEPNFVCGSDTVTFYASNITLANELKTNLINFEATLPESVVVTYF